MQRVDVYFGLGSNLGNREENLRTALQMMADAFGDEPRKTSTIIETPSWGFEGADFLNLCVRFRLPRPDQITPRQHALMILDQVKNIERQMGRVEEVPATGAKREYHDRPIDIDILFYGEESIEDARLIIPHPHIQERDFVKIPLKEIATGKIMTMIN